VTDASPSTGLGLGAATALVISHTIAVGIFLTPAELIGALASPSVTLLLWVGCAGLILAGAFTFGELASRYPRAGGLYVYLREAWGPRIAFLYGWQSLLIMDPGVTAALAAGASQYVGLIWPEVAAHQRLVAAGLIWMLAALNMAGLTFGARVFGLMTILKLCTLSGIVLLALTSSAGSWSHFASPASRPPAAPPLGEAVALGLISVFFSFGGFWETSRIAAEVRDPRRTLPRALVLGVLAVTVIYVMTTMAFIYLVPPASVTSASELARQMGEALIGPSGPAMLAGVVLVSVIASAMAMIMVSPRLYEAMAQDGLFPAAVAGRHPRTGAPVRATALLALLATLFVLLGTFEQIVTFFIGTALVFIALAAAALFVVRRRVEDRGAYRAPGYPLTPALFVLLVLAIVLMVAVNRPWQAASGLGIVLVGLAAYRLLVPARPGRATGGGGR
jgi:APA family basic amino acid/polyamine antiporter